MLSVASLLNPANSEPPTTRLPPSPSTSLCTSSPSYAVLIEPWTKRKKMTKDAAIFSKGKIKGDVNFPPFEDLDEETMREVQKFQVFPLGKIQNYSRHIPYNSEKKNFLEKTGRESFEVFQYIFKVPGDDKDYTVMWDYNIGLVRITPFFKCCKYSKTTPAKMLGLNPGLKEITHSITGGALAAQGYWMPYSCALAVCTTFCSHIAPALIPIFGPTFPSKCVVPAAPEHGRMIIDPQIIIAATTEAENYRLQYSSITPKSSVRDSASPQQSSYSSIANTPPTSSAHLEKRLRLKRAYGCDSPYAESITDGDAASETSSVDAGYFCSSMTPTSATSMTGPIPTWGTHTRAHIHAHQHQNMVSHSANSSINIGGLGGGKLLATSAMGGVGGHNPWLSAIPRSVAGLPIPEMRNWQAKRRVEEVEERPADEEYDGEESASVTTGDEKSPRSEEKVFRLGINPCAKPIETPIKMHGSLVPTSTAEEKKAAWLLMNLSVKDAEGSVGGLTPPPDMSSARWSDRDRDGDIDAPRVKRRRATSL